MIPSVLNSKRIRILNQSKINELYEIPKFSDDERRWYFELNNSEHELLKLPVTRKTKVDAILQLGYFKAKNQFFKYQHNEVKSDVGYIVNRYFDENQLTRPILDNLAMMFCYFANQFQVAVEEKSKELIIANAIEKDAQDDCVVRLLRIFIDTGIDDSVPFKIIKEPEFCFL